MGIYQKKNTKNPTEASSNYSIRKTYLQAMREFMTDTSELQNSGDVEKYLLYEKRVSHQIQKRVKCPEDEVV